MTMMIIRQRDTKDASHQSGADRNGSANGSSSPRRRCSSDAKAHITKPNGSHYHPLVYLFLGALVGIAFCASFRQRGKSLQSCSAVDVALLNNVGSTGGAIVTIRTPPKFYAFQPNIKIKAHKKLFQKLPKGKERTFYAHMSKICHPMIRALRDLGWHKVEKVDDARLIYTYARKTSWYEGLHSWQRYNHIPNTKAWNQKDRFAKGFRKYEEKTGIRPYFVPLTYDLTVTKEKEQFRSKLFKEGGLDHPWVLKIPNVNQGKGITMLGPNSDELKEVFKTIVQGKDRTRYIIQQYICNEMTWNRRKFDIRVFWLVASLDPLIVLYIDGYVRIGNAEYNEKDFSDTRNHLTTHTFLGEEGKASYAQLNDRILQHVEENPLLKQRIPDPVTHVRSQFKESIGMLADAFKGETFSTKDLSSEDAFELYGADSVLDNDLDIWMIEAQDDTGMDEDHYFRLEMHHEIFYGMGLVLSEIWDKQAKGLPILPLENTGKWEVVYADGWRFKYEGYERSESKKSCGL